MKRNITFTFSLLLFLLQRGASQQLVPTVVASSGGFYTSTAGMLSFTTGEMSAIETYATPNVILTQGFQQSWDFGTSIDEHADPGFSFEVFPNPSGGLLTLMTTGDKNGDIEIRIVDVLGKEIFHTHYFHNGPVHQQMADLSTITPGLYFVVMNRKTKSQLSQTSIIKKIQIVY